MMGKGIDYIGTHDGTHQMAVISVPTAIRRHEKENQICNVHHGILESKKSRKSLSSNGMSLNIEDSWGHYLLVSKFRLLSLEFLP